MQRRPILVTAASRHGSTAQIAAAIHHQISRAGYDVDLVNPKLLHDLSPYGAVIIGSALYGSRWMSAARKLAERNSAALAAKPTWLFSAGVSRPPISGDPSPDISHLMSITKSSGHELFAGKLDRKALRLTERALLHRVGVIEGDYRDWEHIRAWTARVIDVLQSQANGIQPLV